MNMFALDKYCHNVTTLQLKYAKILFLNFAFYQIYRQYITPLRHIANQVDRLLQLLRLYSDSFRHFETSLNFAPLALVLPF
jgi:hypothetical protein